MSSVQVGDRVFYRGNEDYLWEVVTLMPDGQCMLSRRVHHRRATRILASVVDIEIIEPAIGEER